MRTYVDDRGWTRRRAGRSQTCVVRCVISCDDVQVCLRQGSQASKCYLDTGGATALEGSQRGDAPPASPGPASTAGQPVQQHVEVSKQCVQHLHMHRPTAVC